MTGDLKINIVKICIAKRGHIYITKPNYPDSSFSVFSTFMVRMNNYYMHAIILFVFRMKLSIWSLNFAFCTLIVLNFKNIIGSF